MLLILPAAAMEAFKWCFQEYLPQYLKSLPIPSTVDGIATLTLEQCLQLAPLAIFLAIALLSLLLSPLFFYGWFCTKKKVLHHDVYCVIACRCMHLLGKLIVGLA